MRRAAGTLAVLLALAASGCAGLVPAPSPAPPPAPAVTPPPASPGTAAAVPDTNPSPEALAVLATIPEPLGAAPAPVVRVAPPAAYDTLRTAVPVPSPTQPLRPATVLPEVAPPAADSTPAPPAAGAPPDTCWRIQIAAPADRARGKEMRDASESLLMVPMIVDREGGRFKVRSRDCLSREAAESLKARAIESGFKGAFLVRLVTKR